MDYKNHLESLLVGAFFMAIFLPVRLVFFTYVSDHWLGSLGIISSMIIVLTYFSIKGKLGYIGRIFLKKIQSIKKSKYVKFAIAFNIILIFYAVSFVTSLNVDVSSSFIYEEAARSIQDQDITSFNELPLPLLGSIEEILTFLTRFVSILLLPIINFELFVVIAHLTDELTSGWTSHFAIVILVESIESICVLVYFKYFSKLGYGKKSNDNKLEPS